MTYTPVDLPGDGEPDVVEGELATVAVADEVAVQPRAAFLPMPFRLTEPASENELDKLYAWCFDTPVRAVSHLALWLLTCVVNGVDRGLDATAGTPVGRFLGVLAAGCLLIFIIRIF